ncbi:MAG TPA: ketopantoate reductase C-terminal domain-containing protein [Gemmataceae bacterium]|jgi:2-dehydropantoate 2-reductase
MEAVHVVGCGAIGCAIGYSLRAAGIPVTFVDTDVAKIEWGRRHGVIVDRLPPHPATFVPFADWQPPTDAVVLLCTKCYDNAVVLERVPQSARLIPIQNGFDPLLHARGHAVEGIASFVSECLPHRTHTRITRAGQLHFGYRLSALGSRPEIPQCVRILAESRKPTTEGRIRVEMVKDILPYKYTKLMYNAAISPLASAAGLDNGQLLRLPWLRGLFFDLLRENHAVLRRAGVQLGKVGPLHPSTVATILRRPWLAHMLAWAFYPGLRKTYCSMSGDLPAGRTEIDYYNGHLLELAGDAPCPLNRRVYTLVKRMERERMAPRLVVLEQLRSPELLLSSAA